VIAGLEPIKPVKLQRYGICVFCLFMFWAEWLDYGDGRLFPLIREIPLLNGPTSGGKEI
jgi:hypothetical protein